MNIESQIKNYLMCIMGVGATTDYVHAAVSHTDLIPDVVVGLGSTYSLDIDGANDIEFYFYLSAGATWASFRGKRANDQIALDNSNFHASDFGTCSNVNSGVSASWSQFGILSDGSSDGNLGGVGDRYLAVTFRRAGATYYGWILVNIGLGGSSITIKSYAVETVAATTIKTGPCGVLPVDLLSFTGVDHKGKVRLNWLTGTEVNCSHFDIERSVDGRNFEKIGSETGNGTTNFMQQYVWYDPYAKSGVNYYRLKQVDLDGQFEYLKTVAVQVDDDVVNEIKVHPNPSNGKNLFFSITGFERETAQLTIVSQLGQVVYDGKLEQVRPHEVHAVTMVETLPEGIYAVNLVGATMKHSTMLVVSH